VTVHCAGNCTLLTTAADTSAKCFSADLSYVVLQCECVISGNACRVTFNFVQSYVMHNNNNNNLICIAPVCAKKTSVALHIVGLNK